MAGFYEYVNETSCSIEGEELFDVWLLDTQETVCSKVLVNILHYSPLFSVLMIGN